MTGPVAALQVAALCLAAAALAVLELLYLPAYVGSVPAPVSAGVAALTTPWLGYVAASVSPRAAVAIAPMGAWLVTVFAAGNAGPGGDVLLPPDWRALLLLGAGIIPSLFVLSRAPAPAAVTSPAPTEDRRPRQEQHG